MVTSCLLLVGMQPAPQDELRQAFSLTNEDKGVDQQTVLRVRKRAAEGFRQQLIFGAPSNGDVPEDLIPVVKDVAA